jgi:hypothetical protein
MHWTELLFSGSETSPVFPYNVILPPAVLAGVVACTKLLFTVLTVARASTMRLRMSRGFAGGLNNMDMSPDGVLAIELIDLNYGCAVIAPPRVGCYESGE